MSVEVSLAPASARGEVSLAQPRYVYEFTTWPGVGVVIWADVDEDEVVVLEEDFVLDELVLDWEVDDEVIEEERLDEVFVKNPEWDAELGAAESAAAMLALTLDL